MPSTRRQLLQLALEILAPQVGGTPPAGIEVRIVSIDGAAETILRSRPGELRPVPSQLPERQRRILSVLSPDVSLTTAQVARETGYQNNSALRAALSELQDLGLARHIEGEGYRLSGDNH